MSDENQPPMRINTAVRQVATVVGVLLALACFEHGFFEALQGNAPTPGHIIQAIGPSVRWWSRGTEEAFTLIPNFLATGLAAMAVSLAIIGWCVVGLSTKHGAAVFALLCVLAIFVGGGIGFTPFFLVTFGYATRIRAPLDWWRRVLPRRQLPFLGALWPFSLAATALCWLLAVEIAVWGYFPRVTDPNALLAICWSSLLVALILVNLSFVGAFAADIAREPSGAAVSPAPALSEVAPGVHLLSLGTLSGNVYFVKPEASWTLVDTSVAKAAGPIQKAAEALFGTGTRPASIVLTHVHPDHAGSARALARAWDCPVYIPTGEMQLAVVRNLDSVRQYANPLDHWIILPILRALPRRWVQTALEKESLQEVARPLEPDAAIPGLPGWRSIMTPGHSPGHLSFFRESDRVLLSGDALLTVDMGSVGGLLAWLLRPRVARVCAPPWYTNWDAQKTRDSIAAIARLEPRVVAGGHGVPLSSDGTASLVHDYAARMGATASGSP